MRRKRPIVGLFSAGVFLCAAAAAAFSQEPDVEQLLARADEFYQNGNFNLAVGIYLEAAGMSRSRINLSRAYFGLSICFFEQKDSASAAKYLRKVAEVDPNKRISELFYPKAFVEMFDAAMKEAQAREEPSPPEKAVEEPKPKAGAERAVEPPLKARPGTEARRPDVSFGDEPQGGHFEINVHYSAWTVDPILSLFESRLTNELAEELQNEVVKKVGASYSGLVKAAFNPVLALESEGSNYGIELRYFSRGRAGTFSFGLGLEQTRIRFGVTGSIAQDFTIGSRAEVEAEAFVEIKPLCPHVSFRWDIGRPGAAVKPFVAFGVGVAPLKGTFTFAYAGRYAFGFVTDSISDSQTKTLAELSEDIDFDIPDYLPILQLGVGLRVELFRGLFLLGEAGVWDGLLLRGGLGFRF